MAQSRLEKIGTIYTRVISLLRGKAIKEEDKPLWLTAYAAFPPKYEPQYDRRLPKKLVRPIFYEEDLIRAKFYKDQSSLPATNLAEENIKSATQFFLSMYKMIQEQQGLLGDNIYKQAIQQYKFESEARKESRKAKNPSFN